MTLKQDEFIKRLPENGFNISKTAREVGYTEGSSKAGSLYNSLRPKIQKAFSPDGVKADIVKYEKKFLKDGDNSNLARMVELRSKASGLTKEQPLTGSPVFVGIIEELKTNVCKVIDSNNIPQDKTG